MAYVYTGMWFLIGLLLIVTMRKERVLVFAGAYFLFLGLWQLLDLRTTIGFFTGIPGIIFKVISVIALLIFSLYYYQSWKQKNQQESGKKENE